MQKANCFTLHCFSYTIVNKKQGRSKFFSERELVLTMSIGNQISAIRKEQQLTQEHFGELFHVTRQTVSNWENEKSYPDLQIFIAMSNQFDVSLDTLLKGDSKMVKAIDKERGFCRIVIDRANLPHVPILRKAGKGTGFDHHAAEQQPVPDIVFRVFQELRFLLRVEPRQTVQQHLQNFQLVVQKARRIVTVNAIAGEKAVNRAVQTLFSVVQEEAEAQQLRENERLCFSVLSNYARVLRRWSGGSLPIRSWK